MTWMELMICERRLADRKGVIPPELMKLVMDSYRAMTMVGKVVYIKHDNTDNPRYLIWDYMTDTVTNTNAKCNNMLKDIRTTELPDHKILMLAHVDAEFPSRNEAYVLNPGATTARSERVPFMNIPRRSFAFLKLKDGKVMVSGGINQSCVRDTIEVFDPATWTWTTSTLKLPSRDTTTKWYYCRRATR